LPFREESFPALLGVMVIMAVYKFYKRNRKGITIVELIIVSIVFSLFLVAIYTILDAGLKSWNMGQTRTDLQNSGQVVIRRMVRELTMASQNSLMWDRNGYNRALAHIGGTDIVHEYIVFETPIRDSAFAYQEDNFGTPLWQGYIAYYVLPQDSDTASDGKNPPKILYRRYMPHIAQRTMPSPLPLAMVEPKFIPPPCPPAEPGPDPVPIAKNVDTFDVIRDGFIVQIKIIYRKPPVEGKEDSPHYSVAGTANKGVELFELQASVEPKN